MVIFAVIVKAPVSVAEGVKERLAMSLEAFGALRVTEVRETDEDYLLLTAVLDAPQGSGDWVRKQLDRHMERFSDTRVVSFREDAPVQMSIREVSA